MPIQPYDEWYHAGTLRPPVASLCRRTGVDLARPTAACVAALTCRPLGDAARILPLPLVLADDEYTRVIVPGVAQRARALQGLFHDLFAGERTLVRRRLVGDALIDRASAGEGCTADDMSRLWHGRSPGEVRFVYGPDLMRDDSGGWVVLEDNIGCVGGVGDGWPVLSAYLAASGVALAESVRPRDELESAVRALVGATGITPGDGDILGLPGDPAGGALLDDDRSAERKATALAGLGLRVGSDASARRSGDAPSAVVNLGGTMSPDFRRRDGRWFAEHRVPTLGAPGVGILSSKAFLPLVDDVIRLVLGEEPILPTAPTTPVAPSPQDPVDTLGVVKRINGCGGSEVLFLADHDAHELPRLRDVVAGWGKGGAVWQQFVTGSVIPAAGPGSWQGFRVELRPIAYVVGAAAVVVADVPVGRAMSTLGDRRGNLTRGAHYLPVLREPVPNAAPTTATTGSR